MNLRMTITESEITNMPLVVGPNLKLCLLNTKNPSPLKELLERSSWKEYIKYYYNYCYYYYWTKFLKVKISFLSAPKFPEVLYQICIFSLLCFYGKLNHDFLYSRAKSHCLLPSETQQSLISAWTVDFRDLAFALNWTLILSANCCSGFISFLQWPCNLSGSCQAQREYRDLEINTGSQKIKDHIHAHAHSSLQCSVALQVTTFLFGKAHRFLYIMDFSGNLQSS